ncbi:NADPH:quinone oxidoreductase family protein [Zavarzinia compransoris]|uniref:NADPH:quinone oxidoreductase n=1 Tax=Zavarzinia compransoris TaxID=1264899 RepID=A0A317EAV0_9PROT|nr:NADPH:quinone oxidoreductase [Zavarzinia compransoris]
MKVLHCKAYGPPEALVLEDVAPAALGRGEVRVRLHAAGVNFPDVLIIQGKYQFKPEMPFAPGGEAAGVVTEVGERVEGFKPGDKVIVMTGWGAFAEELVVTPDRLAPLPPSMPFEEGAAFLMTYATSHHALKQRARLQPGESLLVLGAAGGVGLAAVELGKAMGARVIAGVSTDEKAALARAHGADEVIVYSREGIRDRLKALAPQGVDVVYDPVGGDYSEQALRSIAWKGRFLVVGFASGPIPSIPLNLALLKGCEIVGVFWGAFTAREPDLHRANVAELVGLYEAGKIRPLVSKTYPLAEGGQAIRDMMERKVTGKTVVTM